MDSSDNGCPERLGKFEIKRRLGKGATSHVYQAFDPFRDIDVAIKVLDPSVFEEASNDNMGKTGFMVEASLVGKLDHPHIARIYDVVAEPKQHYVVMEYVGGGTLEQFCHAGNLMDVDTAVDVIFKCGKALEYVNQLGLVHRDIKPANLLLADGSDVKVSDFGAAQSKSVTSSHHLRVGSPYFMSPEQLNDGVIDFRSDIYSLSVVLYQLLTGKRPFEATSIASLLKQILEITPNAPGAYQPIPKALEDVVMRALEKKPANRYSSWGKFLEDLCAARLPAGANIPIASEADRFGAVRACKFFKSFPDPAIWEVLQVAEFRRVTEGDILIREGALGDFFFVVLGGRIRISRKGKVIDVLSPGACVGELSYVLEGNVPRSATCVALEDGVILKIHDEWLRDASGVCRLLFERVFLRQLSQRLIEADIRLTEGATA